MKILSKIILILALTCSMASFCLAADEIKTVSCDQVISGAGMPNTTMQYYQKGTNFRLETFAQGKKVIMINSGGKVITYYPDQNMAMDMPASGSMMENMGSDLDKNPAKFKEYMDSLGKTSLGEETIDGKVCEIYAFDGPQGNKSKVWIAKDVKWPMKTVTSSSRGEITVEYKNLKINQPLSDSLFTLPAGVNKTDMSDLMQGAGQMMNNPQMQEKMKKMMQQYQQ